MKAKFTVTPEVAQDLAFAIVSLEAVFHALLIDKQQNKLAISRCRSSLIRLKAIALVAQRALLSTEAEP